MAEEDELLYDDFCYYLKKRSKNKDVSIHQGVSAASVAQQHKLENPGEKRMPESSTSKSVCLTVNKKKKGRAPPNDK